MDEIEKLIHDLRCSDPDEMYNEVLKERVRYFKETKEGQEENMGIWDEIRQEGYTEGYAEGLLEALTALMKNKTISLEEAMELLSMTAEEFSYYQSIFEKIEDEYDIIIAKQAYDAYLEDPETISHDELLKMFEDE